MNQPQPSSGFNGLGIAPRLLDALDRLKFTVPTPIQQRSIPVGISGKDLIAIAQTGTGKTLAFGIPMLQRLEQVKGQGLIILPTRELAIQVDEAIQSIGRSMGLRTAVLIGGASMIFQRKNLERKPHIIIATPGRLLDHMEQRTVRLSDTKILVLDEADRMLDMGFAPQIKKILAAVPRERQTMLFSATMPTTIVGIARQHMQLPIQVEIARSGTVADKVTQEVYFLDSSAKPRLLELTLQQALGPILVFTRTKHAAKKLTRLVKTMGHTSAEIHSNRSLAQRREALDGFKSGKYRVLIATDIAARGIDVTGIELVVNFDLPTNAEDYVHRIGRTGRAGQSGRAISFATFDQRGDVRSIERLMRIALPVKRIPELPPARSMPHVEPDREERPRRFSGPRRGGAPFARGGSRGNARGGPSQGRPGGRNRGFRR
ncbi:MAG: DEAD/DEAH box helicase [Patescibacteria group bacterium]